MGDLPCRIAQAHTAAEQTRKRDEGNNGNKSTEGHKEQKTLNYHPSPSQIKPKVKRSQMKESAWEGER